MSSVAAAAVPGRSARLLAEATVWPKSSVVALGQVRSGVAPIESAGNILAVYVDRSEAFTVRVNLVAPVGILDGARHFARLDGRDKRGVRLAPGLYFVRLCHGSERRIQRLVIMP